MTTDKLIELMAKAMRDSEPGMEGKSHLYWIPSAKAALEALSSSGYMVVEGWKPIADGCPTDGRPILACGGIINNGAVRRASAYGEWWQSERARYGAKAPPTHWMPLPLPPQAKISDEERSDEVEPASNSASLTP